MSFRLWRFRLQDILEAIARIQSYTQGMDVERLKADRKTLDAVERNFIIIGEAASHIPDEIAGRFTSVPWREMQDMRNIVVHAYWGVDIRRVWDTIQQDLPPLIPLLKAILDSESDDG